MLMLLLNYRFVKKKDNKKDLIKPIDPGGFKKVFILLAKSIIV